VKAMRCLALCYYNEKGTEKYLEKAFHWFQKAAEGESVKAMHCLALNYYNGEGIEKDLEKAFYLFHLKSSRKWKCRSNVLFGLLLL
jgi:TPR repeat protein